MYSQILWNQSLQTQLAMVQKAQTQRTYHKDRKKKRFQNAALHNTLYTLLSDGTSVGQSRFHRHSASFSSTL